MATRREASESVADAANPNNGGPRERELATEIGKVDPTRVYVYEPMIVAHGGVSGKRGGRREEHTESDRQRVAEIGGR